MRLVEREFDIASPRFGDISDSYLYVLAAESASKCGMDDNVVRFTITESDANRLHCEIGVIEWGPHAAPSLFPENPFNFRKRRHECVDQFNAALVIPTGVGAEFGGHAGDGGAVARLVASACDNLITHPNVVNACDYNEIPENALYVEGSSLDRLLMGKVGLRKVRSNKIMLVVDTDTEEALVEKVINVVGAARATLGLDCEIQRLKPAFKAEALKTSSGRATGLVTGFEHLTACMERHEGDFDALALVSEVKIPPGVEEAYFATQEEAVNPWGGAEAMITHAASLLYNVPAAHAPILPTMAQVNRHWGLVDPRKAAEVESATFLFCLLKGLRRSPGIVKVEDGADTGGCLMAEDVSCLIIPDGCVGIPLLAALNQGIPVIAVKNRNLMENNLLMWPFKDDKLFFADSYLEAVGIMGALKAGVTVDSVRRPLPATVVRA